MTEALPLDTFVDLIAEHSFHQLMSGGSGRIDDLTWPAAIYSIDRGELYDKIKNRLDHREKKYYHNRT